MKIFVAGHYTKDSCLTQSKHHQGFDSDGFCHHYCFCRFWMEYYVELWMEIMRKNLEVERITGRYGICGRCVPCTP
jgi:hypothetical protein